MLAALSFGYNALRTEAADQPLSEMGYLEAPHGAQSERPQRQGHSRTGEIRGRGGQGRKDRRDLTGLVELRLLSRAAKINTTSDGARHRHLLLGDPWFRYEHDG